MVWSTIKLFELSTLTLSSAAIDKSQQHRIASGTPRIEPGTGGWKAQTLPLCYAVPPFKPYSLPIRCCTCRSSTGVRRRRRTCWSSGTTRSRTDSRSSKILFPKTKNEFWSKASFGKTATVAWSIGKFWSEVWLLNWMINELLLRHSKLISPKCQSKNAKFKWKKS